MTAYSEPAHSGYRAQRLPRYPGPAGWNEILPERSPCPPLQEHATADIAIVGAGFAGLSAARRLLQHDDTLHIAVLEAGQLAQGSAGRNSGFMIDVPHELSSEDYAGQSTENDLEQIRLNRAAIAFAREAAEEFALDRCIFDSCGKINAAATERGVESNRVFAGHLERLGEACEFYDTRAMQEITGTTYYRSGLFSPGTVMLQPAAYIRGLYQGMEAHLRLFEGCPVHSFERQGPDWRLHTPAGSLDCGKIILAVNGHAESFGFFKRRLLHVFTYASMSQAMTRQQSRALGGQSNWSLTPADPMGVTVRKLSSPGENGERILVRSRFTYDPSMEVSKGRMRSVAARHDRQFQARFPMLGDLDMQYRWGGQLCLSLNSVPAFGEVDENVFSAICQNGLGLTRGTLSGMAAADLAVGEASAAVAALEKLPQPRKLPPEPIAWMGVNALLAFKEFRAGGE